MPLNPFELHKDPVYNKCFFHPQTNLKNRNFKFKTCGECRVDIIPSSQIFLTSRKKHIFLWVFSNFHTKLSYMHCNIVFIPRPHKTRFLPSISCSLHSFFSFWFVRNMASTVTSQLTFSALCWSNNIVAQRFSTAVPRELYVPQRNIPKWIW